MQLLRLVVVNLFLRPLQLSLLLVELVLRLPQVLTQGLQLRLQFLIDHVQEGGIRLSFGVELRLQLLDFAAQLRQTQMRLCLLLLQGLHVGRHALTQGLQILLVPRDHLLAVVLRIFAQFAVDFVGFFGDVGKELLLQVFEARLRLLRLQLEQRLLKAGHFVLESRLNRGHFLTLLGEQVAHGLLLLREQLLHHRRLFLLQHRHGLLMQCILLSDESLVFFGEMLFVTLEFAFRLLVFLLKGATGGVQALASDLLRFLAFVAYFILQRLAIGFDFTFHFMFEGHGQLAKLVFVFHAQRFESFFVGAHEVVQLGREGIDRLFLQLLHATVQDLFHEALLVLSPLLFRFVEFFQVFLASEVQLLFVVLRHLRQLAFQLVALSLQFLYVLGQAISKALHFVVSFAVLVVELP